MAQAALQCVASPVFVIVRSSFFSLRVLLLTHFGETPEAENLLHVFSSFHGQRSVTAAWAIPSPWNILKWRIPNRLKYSDVKHFSHIRCTTISVADSLKINLMTINQELEMACIWNLKVSYYNELNVWIWNKKIVNKKINKIVWKPDPEKPASVISMLADIFGR